MVLLGGAEIWTTCWSDPAPVTFHWQESTFTTNQQNTSHRQGLQNPTSQQLNKYSNMFANYFLSLSLSL